MLEKTLEYLNKRLDELYLLKNMSSVALEIYDLENIIKEVKEVNNESLNDRIEELEEEIDEKNDLIYDLERRCERLEDRIENMRWGD